MLLSNLILVLTVKFNVVLINYITLDLTNYKFEIEFDLV